MFRDGVDQYVGMVIQSMAACHGQDLSPEAILGNGVPLQRAATDRCDVRDGLFLLRGEPDAIDRHDCGAQRAPRSYAGLDRAHDAWASYRPHPLSMC